MVKCLLYCLALCCSISVSVRSTLCCSTSVSQRRYSLQSKTALCAKRLHLVSVTLSAPSVYCCYWLLLLCAAVPVVGHRCTCLVSTVYSKKCILCPQGVFDSSIISIQICFWHIKEVLLNQTNLLHVNVSQMINTVGFIFTHILT